MSTAICQHKLRKLHATGLTDTEIARSLGVTVATVTEERDALGLPRHSPSRRVSRIAWTDADDAQLRRLKAVGKSDAEIGEIMDRSRASIRQRRAGLGLRGWPSVGRRPGVNNRDWVDAEVKLLRDWFSRRCTVAQIAAELCRTEGSVKGKIRQMGLRSGQTVAPSDAEPKVKVRGAPAPGDCAEGRSSFVARRYGQGFAARLSGIAPGDGAYRELEALAQARRISRVQVVQAWHAVRREVAHA